MSPDDTHRPTPPSSSSSNATPSIQGTSSPRLAPRPSSSSAETSERGRPPGRPPKGKAPVLDPDVLKRARAEAEAEAERRAAARRELQAQADRLKKEHEQAERARKREQRDYAKKAALQSKRLRKRFGSVGATVLEELEGTEHGRKLWTQLKPHLKAAGLVDELFEELKKLEAFQEALKP